MARKPKAEKAAEPLGKTLWKSADKLRKKMDAAEYKHIVLGLIFLRYIGIPAAWERLHPPAVRLYPPFAGRHN